jgi:hypothetical protein
MHKIQTDIAVIGGGPAGMTAAGKAGEKAKTILIEKQHDLGQKLLLTGGGRCNITTSITDVQAFIDEIGDKGDFLYSSLYKFGVKQTLEFFNDLGVETKEERGKRVFPKSDKAETVLNALKDNLGRNKVEFHLNTQVNEIKKAQEQFHIFTDDSEVIAKKVIVATGGLSYPVTGSSGDGYDWARDLGHNVIPPKPALSSVVIKEKWINKLQGLSLKNVRISIYQNNKKQIDRFGEAIFTDFGMSGPIIIDMSEEIGELLRNDKGDLELQIDFKPALDYPKLDRRLLRELDQNGKKMFKNILSELLPSKIIPTFIKLSGIPASKPGHQITGPERSKLLHLLKELTLQVESLGDIKYAIITAGGIDLKEVDPKTMESKLVNGLYFAGEVLDINGPTGGFNLQICWSTGYVSGESAAKSLSESA